jgi:hypothetical protein
MSDKLQFVAVDKLKLIGHLINTHKTLEYSCPQRAKDQNLRGRRSAVIGRGHLCALLRHFRRHNAQLRHQPHNCSVDVSDSAGR